MMRRLFGVFLIWIAGVAALPHGTSPAWAADSRQGTNSRQALWQANTDEMNAVNQLAAFLLQYAHVESKPAPETIQATVQSIQILCSRIPLSSKGVQTLIDFYVEVGGAHGLKDLFYLFPTLGKHLTMHAMMGRLEPQRIDDLIMRLPNDPVAESILLAASHHPQRDRLILQRLEEISFEMIFPGELPDHPEFLRAVRLIHSLDLSSKESERWDPALSRFFQDGKHPWKAAALMIAKPEWGIKQGIELPQEGLPFFAQENTERYLVSIRYRQRYPGNEDVSPKEYAARMIKAQSEVQGALRVALRNPILATLRQFALADLSLDASFGIRTVALAISLDLRDATPYFTQLARAGLPHGPEMSSDAAASLRRDLIRYAVSFNTSEMNDVVIRAMRDPDPTNRMIAGVYLTKLDLNLDSRRLLNDTVRSIQESGEDLKDYLRLRPEHLAALRRMSRIASLVSVNPDSAPAPVQDPCEQVFLGGFLRVM